MKNSLDIDRPRCVRDRQTDRDVTRQTGGMKNSLDVGRDGFLAVLVQVRLLLQCVLQASQRYRTVVHDM